VWVGGNIGKSLLDGLGQIAATDIVVLELSSFQLQRTPAVRWSPHVAVITGITPNHLDWHGSFDAYAAAKLNIVRFQEPGRDAVVIQDTPELCRIVAQLGADGAPLVRDALVRESLLAPVNAGIHSRAVLPDAWRYRLDGDVPTAARGDEHLRWPRLQLHVPGRHNRENAAAALTIAHWFGIPDEAALAALATFAALPHRLQLVAERDGVTYYDDSKSTTPEAALTALGAIDGPLLVILGGYDKGSDLQPVAEAAARRAKFAACIGKTGPGLADTIRAAGGQAEVFPDLTAAVAACRQRAAPGDAVLLSPACASWGQFVDYRQRGELFTRLARGAAAT
jgi:UDP-N-acetylmuramoylalanine--D-glutamate ligase